MKLTWFGHSAFGLEFGKAKVLIDPMINNTPWFDSNLYADAIDGTTHIVLTHGHADHIGDTVDIAAKTGAVVVANFDLCMWLAKKGVENIDPTNTGGTVFHDEFSVTYVQAHHSSAHIDDDGVSHCLGNANGVVLHIDGDNSVYHMGDTDIFGDMALIQELHQPQIGLVPIGDRFTMGGTVAALACQRYFEFDKIFPCHFGSFPIIDQTDDKFVQAMGDDSSKIVSIAPGASIEV